MEEYLLTTGNFPDEVFQPAPNRPARQLEVGDWFWDGGVLHYVDCVGEERYCPHIKQGVV